MAGTKFSDYLGLNHYKKAKKLKHFIYLRLPQRPQSLSTYDSISPTVNSGHRLKKYVLYVLVKSAVYLKWQVGFENDMKITPIFTITFSSKMLIRQCFTSLTYFFRWWPQFTVGDILSYVLKLWGPWANLKQMKSFNFFVFL